MPEWLSSCYTEGKIFIVRGVCPLRTNSSDSSSQLLMGLLQPCLFTICAASLMQSQGLSLLCDKCFPSNFCGNIDTSVEVSVLMGVQAPFDFFPDQSRKLQGSLSALFEQCCVSFSNASQTSIWENKLMHGVVKGRSLCMFWFLKWKLNFFAEQDSDL